MPKASIWHAAPIVVVKFPHRSPGNPSVFVRNWRSVGERLGFSPASPEQRVKHRAEAGELLMLREIERI